MRSRTVRMLSAFIGLVLVLATPSGALCSANGAQPPKDEVIYAKLGANGNAEACYVVNCFDVVAPSSFSDFGDYAGVRNLSTLDGITQSGDSVQISAPKGRFCYQGTLSHYELPWIIDISYLLDGAPISGQNLAGRSGKLSILMDVRSNPNAKSVFADNYSLQVTMTVDADLCTAIVAKDATIVTTGGSKTLSFVKLPGQSAHYSVAMDVRDFEMGGIQFVGVPFSAGFDVPDTSSIASELASLSHAITALDNGLQSAKGAGDLIKGGLFEFNGGLVTIKEGLDDLDAGLLGLANQNESISGGFEQIRSALDTMRQNLNAMEADIDLTSLGAASSALAQGINEISNGLNALKDGFAQTDAAILAQTGQQSLEEANEAAILFLSQQILALQADPVGNAEQIESLTGIVALLNANNSLVANLRLGICGDGTEDVPGLASALNGLSTQFQSFDGAIQDLPGQLEALFDGIIALKTGVGQLYDSSVAFGTGLNAYLDGTHSIQSGLHSLCAGFGDALDACSDLQSGVESLRLGLYGLADGSRQLRYATSGMDRSIENAIDDLLEDYLPGDFALLSFVSGKNDNVRSVQFILKSDDISIGE